jgi:hypothetical protein
LGEEWRWIDTPPVVAVSVGATLSENASLLSVSDRDESWEVSAHLLDAAPHVGATWRNLTLLADVPLRAEWQGDVGVGDPRASLLLASEAWGVLRGSVTAPVGTLGWPYTWEEWRGGLSVSQTHGRVAAMLGAEKGTSGWGLRGALGAHLPWLNVEVAGTRTWTEIPVVSVEAMLSRTFVRGSVALSPFLSTGILPGVGSPSLRGGIDVRRRPRPASLPVVAPPPVSVEPPTSVAPPPSVPVEPPASVEPPPSVPVERPASVEPPPAPTPSTPALGEPPTPVEPPPPPAPPRILRARVERHAACVAAPDEAAILQRLTDKAVAYLRAQGGESAEIEVTDAACAEKRWVDLIVVEVR